jgi:hypothetical protein
MLKQVRHHLWRYLSPLTFQLSPPQIFPFFNSSTAKLAALAVNAI